MNTPNPNILFITTDQQRFDATGNDGPSFLRTPHYGMLCREGVTFTRAYADCPICVPARVSMMTGQYVFHHGMSFNGKTSTAMGYTDTLPGFLRKCGYQTAAIGKMHFGPQRMRHGFDEMILPDDYYREMQRFYYPLMPMRHGLGQNELYPGMATVPEALTLTSWIAEKCVEYIRERRDPSLPFLLWCSFSKPHPPLDPPEPYYSMYRQSPIPDPIQSDWAFSANCPETVKRRREQGSSDQISSETIREARAAYYGLITQIDYNMGRVFAALQDVGLFEETLILYTSDHGEYLGDFGLAGKLFFHEPSAHIPLVLRMPKSWKNRCHGQQNNALVTHADILPTFLKAAGGIPDDDIDGQDLIPLARGEQENKRSYLEATLDYHTQQGIRYLGITDGKWKYIWYPEKSQEQLFDLENDPKETKDLSQQKEYLEIKRELNQELIRREKERGGNFLEKGQLCSKPFQNDTTRDRRNQSWPGYHTEFYHEDVRH